MYQEALADEDRLDYIFVNPYSTSGRIAPECVLRRIGIQPDQSRVTYSYSHTSSLRLLTEPEQGRHRVAFVWDDALRGEPLPMDQVRRIAFPELDRIDKGESLEFEAPTGVKIVIARRGTDGTVDDFVALSSTCPHLGCRVHWEPHNNRFFCPCHNGVFDPQGKAVEGPPAAAGQDLPEYPLRVESGLLFIEAPVVGLTGREEA